MLPGTVRTPDGSERIGVFGGTFDPVHVGHIVGAVEARRALALDRVVLVPAGDPWQKRGSVMVPAADRLAMVEAAVDGIEGLEVSPLEVERDGPSYTYQTLEALSAPGRVLFLIVGADVAATMHSWVGIERLAGLATLVVVDRAGDRPSDGGLPAGWPSERVSIPRLDVSSTELRARAARGWPLDGLVPPGAVRIIAERGLYQPLNAGATLPKQLD
jgi:nicotinate-nucleotide adenylyltransferase